MPVHGKCSLVSDDDAEANRKFLQFIVRKVAEYFLVTAIARINISLLVSVPGKLKVSNVKGTRTLRDFRDCPTPRVRNHKREIRVKRPLFSPLLGVAQAELKAAAMAP